MRKRINNIRKVSSRAIEIEERRCCSPSSRASSRQRAEVATYARFLAVRADEVAGVSLLRRCGPAVRARQQKTHRDRYIYTTQIYVHAYRCIIRWTLGTETIIAACYIYSMRGVSPCNYTPMTRFHPPAHTSVCVYTCMGMYLQR